MTLESVMDYLEMKEHIENSYDRNYLLGLRNGLKVEDTTPKMRRRCISLINKKIDYLDKLE